MSEFVAQTTEAVAVDEDLTILIDWVNIELFAGFTLIVANAGGGSADDITDVQIDESDDGGITPSLDQHADTPAVPIASGNSPAGTFTSTAKFVRVRALCAEGEDTTANAYLIAASSTGRLCLLNDVKERLGISDTESDALINRIILGVGEIFSGHCKKPLLLNAAAVTEYYTVCGKYLQLDRYPTSSELVTSIKIAPDYDYDSAEALTEDTEYRLIRGGVRGIIYRPYLDWPDTPDAIQAVYRGGYCAAGTTPGTGETALPADLREAAIEQASFIYKRKDDIGLSSVGFEGGSMSKFSQIELLKGVRQVLEDYIKRVL